MDLGHLATVAGWVLTILSLAAFVIKPVLGSFTKITSNLTDITHSLDLINRSIEQSQSDRVSLHEAVAKNDGRLDEHQEHLARHDEQLKSLFEKEKES